jgi:hypothetical protein
METTHKTLTLRQMKSDTVKDNGHTSFIWMTALFDEAFKYGDGAKLWGYIGTNVESLCVELSNFVQFLTFVIYLTRFY